MNTRTFVFVIASASLDAFTSPALAGGAFTPNPAIIDYGNQSLTFEPNRGQADNHADFVAHGPGYTLLLSHGGALMVMTQASAKPSLGTNPTRISSTQIRMRVAGANASAGAYALDEQPSKSNYFIGNDPQKWQTNIANYAKIRYHDVYSGIDLIYYGNHRQLEYDFVVAPGADPRSIALEFDRPAKIGLDGSDELILHAGSGELRSHRPVAYQEVNSGRKLVACSYVRRGQKLGFRLGPYDRSKPLVIDPVLEYSTYLGGQSAGLGIAVDKSGNAYVTGIAYTPDFPTTKNAFQDSNLGGASVGFVSKFDSSGRLVYSTYLGGSGIFGGELTAIAVDSHGDAYVTGYTDALDFPVKNPFQSWNNNGGTNPTGTVTKLNPTGSALIYSTYLGGSTDEGGLGIAVDGQQDAYVTGWTFSADFPTKNAFQPVIGGENAFLTKFNAEGTALIYSTFLGGSVADFGASVAVDAQAHAYVTGSSTSPDFPIKDAVQETLKGKQSAFVTKFDATGNKLVYSTYLGGSTFANGDYGSGIAVDLHGNAYVTGFTAAINFPIKNAFQKKLKSPYGNAFVTKLDPAGTELVYSAYLGGSGNSKTKVGDAGNGIAVDQYGNAYVTGSTTSSDFPIKNAFQSKLKSPNGNAFVTKIDAADCAIVFSSYLGGSGIATLGDSGNSIAVDPAGSAHVTGYTSSSDFPAKNAFQNKLKDGGPNVFVTRISPK